MAVKLPSFRLLPAAGAKSRVFIVFFLFLAAIVGGYYVMKYFSGPSTGGSASIAAAPEGLQSIPGGNSSPEFSRAVAAANAEASQKAQMTGGSAVPTLSAVPVMQPTSFQMPRQNCKILCPDRSKVDSKSDIDELQKSGKLTRKMADILRSLVAKNVSADEYAAELDALVKAGKLIPEQARRLLERYRKQYADVLAGKSALFMDGMIQGDRLSLDEANRLLALQKNGISAASYAAALKHEVKDGRLNAASVGQLLGQYTAQQIQEAAAAEAFKLRQLVQQGALTAAVADELAELQKRNVPLSQYEGRVNKLVGDGKMTPDMAKRLTKSYRDQRARSGSTDALSDLIHQLEIQAANCVLDKVGQGGFGRAQADALIDLQQQSVDMPTWQNAVAALEKKSQCTPAVGQQLVICYRDLAALRAESERLQRLQADNASQRAYADELKRAVQTGLLKPQTAADLMQDYSAIVTPVTAVAATTETIVPGAEEFARLQQQVQQNAGQSVQAVGNPSAQFAKVAAEEQLKVSEERQQRILQMQTAMMTQAQTLLTSWQQPPTIAHVAGKEALPGAKKGVSTASATVSGNPGAGSAATGTESAASLTPPLIKSGAILFAVLDTAVDSDYPDTPVMATIVQGPFRGAKLLGKLSLAKGQDRVSLSFNLMDTDAWLKSKSISAFAIDPDTARTVMASSIDHHYLLRYGSLFAASFLSGYSSAITNAGSSTTGIFGTSTTTPALSPGNRIAVALGQVGTALTAATQGYSSTPATVKINSGVALGIMFTADVTESG